MSYYQPLISWQWVFLIEATLPHQPTALFCSVGIFDASFRWKPCFRMAFLLFRSASKKLFFLSRDYHVRTATLITYFTNIRSIHYRPSYHEERLHAPPFPKSSSSYLCWEVILILLPPVLTPCSFGSGRGSKDNRSRYLIILSL